MSTEKDIYGFVLAANIRIYFKILKQRDVFFYLCRLKKSRFILFDILGY